MPKDITTTRDIALLDYVLVPCQITAIAGNVLTLNTINPRNTLTVLTLNANQVIKN